MKDQNTDNPYIEIKWHLSDILECREDLTPSQGLEVLEYLEDNHDCNYGVTWETIDYASDRVVEQWDK